MEDFNALEVPLPEGYKTQMIERIFSLLKNRFVWILALSGILRLTIVFLVSPITDGFYFTTESVSCILSLKNPYDHTFSSIPLDLQTAGSESVFAYLPFVTLFSLPFYLIGDIRYGFILSDLLIGYAVFKITLKDRAKNAIFLALASLFSPFSIGWTAWAGVNTTIGIAFVMLSIMLMRDRKEDQAGICLGLSLAALQLSWIMAPFLYYYSLKKGMKKLISYSLSVFVATMAPFLIVGPRLMINDILLFHLTRQTIPVFKMAVFPYAEINISLNGFLNSLLGFTLPLYLKLAFLLPTLFFMINKAKDFSCTLYYAFVFSLMFLFILPNNLLINYLALPFSLLPIVLYSNTKQNEISLTCPR